MPRPMIQCDVTGVTAALTNISAIAATTATAADIPARWAAEDLRDAEKSFAESSRWKGDLIDSIKIDQKMIGEYYVGPTVDYAPYIEYGTSPHWVAESKLYEWAAAHGISSKYLRDKIGEEGTEAEPFVMPAIEKTKANAKGFNFANIMMLPK